MVWLPDGVKILKLRLFISVESMNMTDGWTNTAWRHRPHLHSIARQKGTEKSAPSRRTFIIFGYITAISLLGIWIIVLLILMWAVLATVSQKRCRTAAQYSLNLDRTFTHKKHEVLVLAKCYYVTFGLWHEPFICRLFVMLLCPVQRVEIFHIISAPFNSLWTWAVCVKIKVGNFQGF